MLFKKKTVKKKYDPAIKRPVIRASICTGEKTAGFQNVETGRFEEVMLIRNENDLNEFKKSYGIREEIPVIY